MNPHRTNNPAERAFHIAEHAARNERDPTKWFDTVNRTMHDVDQDLKEKFLLEDRAPHRLRRALGHAR